MMASSREHEFYNYRLRLGIYATSHTPVETAQTFGERPSFHQYWKAKVTDANFHPQRHGGKRFTKFGVYDGLVHGLVWKALRKNPSSKPIELARYLSDLGFPVSTRYIDRLLKTWNWTKKKSIQHQINKYSIGNIEKYYDFLNGVRDIPWYKLKFLDESHFVSKKCYRTYVWCPANQNVIFLNWPYLDVSYTLTLLTNLENTTQPFWCTLNKNTNNQFSFLEFVLSACENGALVPGDYLICDNSSIHYAQEIQDELGILYTFCWCYTFYVLFYLHLFSSDHLLNSIHVQLKFFPCYSTELNPCELIFQDLKTDVAGYRYLS